MRLGLGGGHEPELGRVRLAHDDETGTLELLEEIARFRRDVTDGLQRAVARVVRRAREHAVVVLDHDRDASERTVGKVTRCGRGAGAIEQRMDHRVQLAVELLDARDRSVDELDR